MTPPSIPPGVVQVHRIDPSDTVAAPQTILTAEELERADRFRFEEDARHWIACRAGLRTILGRALGIDPAAVPIAISPEGKPALAPPFSRLHFNLSHCRDLALAALATDGSVGVDIEPRSRTPELPGCEDGFCHPDEIAALPDDPVARAAALLDLWTAKEALLKASGSGFLQDPKSVKLTRTADFLRADHPLQLAVFSVRHLDHPGLEQHRAAIAAPRGTREIHII